MALADCREITNVSKIKVEENQRKAVFLNDPRENYFRTKVDGCLVVHTLASDWVVSKPTVGDVVVELKGKDVNHAIKQIVSTLSYWKKEGLSNGKLAGLIVCTQYPKISTTVQKAQELIAKDYKAPLHVVTKNYEYKLENVLSFKGPLTA